MALLDFDSLFWLNPAKANAAGLCPISLRLTLHGQRTEISTKLRCQASEWDSSTHRLRTSRGHHPAAKDYNRALDTIEGKVALLRASLPATATLAELRDALLPAPPKRAQLPAPPPCLLVLLEAARQAHPNQFTQASYLTALNRLRASLAPATMVPLPTFTVEAAVQCAAWLREQSGERAANTYLLSLNALWRRAVPAQPSPFVGLFSTARQRPRHPRYVLSVAEVERLAKLDIANTRAGLARDIYLAQYYLHGSRVGVVIELTWQQVDWEQGRVLLKAEKGGSWQRIALRPQLAEVLRRYWPPTGGEGLIFPLLPAAYSQLDSLPRYRARKQAARQVWDGLQTCAKLLELPGRLHSHTARHSLATNTVRPTGDYRLAQRFLGHSTLEMTEKYIRGLLPEELDAGGDAVYGE